MPGQTNNSTILAAENQEIVALNDVAEAIENLTIPPAQVELTLNTTGLETAIATLQTTLVSTLEALRVTVKALNFCCSTSTDDPPKPGEPGGGSPGDPPGDGQTDPPGTTEEKDIRRCKMSIWLIDYYLGEIAEWGDENGADTVINGVINTGLGILAPVALTLAMAAVSAVLSLFITPGIDPTDPFVILIATVITGVVSFAILNGNQLSFSEMKAFIDANRVKMICALYNSKNAWSAHSALMAAIDDTSPGLDTGNRKFIDEMLNTAVLALLFFVDERFDVLEDWIAEHPDECPCEDVPPETGTPADLYKCKATNYLFDGFIDSLTGWGTVANMTWYTTPTFISALTGGLLWTLLGGIYNLVFVGITAVAAFIAKITSFLGVLFWNGFDYFTAFEEIAALFEAQKAAIICELYLAEDVETVRTELENRIDDYIGTVMTAHPEWADQEDTYKDVLKALLPNTVLNVLFEETERPEITDYAPEDFQECTCNVVEDHLILRMCTSEIYHFDEFSPPGQLVVSTIRECGVGGGCWSAWLKFDHNGSGYVEGRVDFTVSVSNIGNSCGGYPRFYYYDQNGNVLSQTNQQNTSLPCAAFQVVSDNSYEITFTISPVA